MRLPLFPLSSHLLPNGRMALRIFEPRYVRMIKETSSEGSGFVICMINSEGNKEDNTHIFPVGTLCKTIDFDLLDDGLLGVTVEGIKCVKITNISTEADELRVGECEDKSDWSCEVLPTELYPLDVRLKEIFARYPEVSNLYDKQNFDDPVWVIHRWLELLPVGAEQKQYFLKEANCNKVLTYLNQLIE